MKTTTKINLVISILITCIVSYTPANADDKYFTENKIDTLKKKFNKTQDKLYDDCMNRNLDKHPIIDSLLMEAETKDSENAKLFRKRLMGFCQDSSFILTGHHYQKNNKDFYEQ